MEPADVPNKSQSVVDPARRRFRPVRSTAWFGMATLTGILLAAASVWVGHFAAPLLIFPLLVGVLLAAALILALRLWSIANRKAAFAGALLAALVLAGARHWFFYVDARRDAQLQQEKLATAAAAAFPELAGRTVEAPSSFLEFLRSSADRGTSIGGRHYGPWALWLLWLLDAAIPLGVALAGTSIALREPYCDRCGTWYRTTRRGTVDSETAAALAQAVASEPRSSSAAYRLQHCAGGCGPSRFELLWNIRGPTGHQTAWIDAPMRASVTAIIDAASAGATNNADTNSEIDLDQDQESSFR